MKTAYTISAIGHAVVLLWSVWSLAANTLPVSSTEGVPVDLITVSEFSNIAAGSKSAPKTETPKPLVEKVAEAKPVEDPTAKVVEKKEVKAAREPPPARETKPAESEPDKKQAEKPPDPTADALAKEEAKKPEPKRRPPNPPAPPEEASPASAQIRSQTGRGAARQARLDAARRRRGDAQQQALARFVERRGGAVV